MRRAMMLGDDPIPGPAEPDDPNRPLTAADFKEFAEAYLAGKRAAEEEAHAAAAAAALVKLFHGDPPATITSDDTRGDPFKVGIDWGASSGSIGSVAGRAPASSTIGVDQRPYSNTARLDLTAGSVTLTRAHGGLLTGISA